MNRRPATLTAAALLTTLVLTGCGTAASPPEPRLRVGDDSPPTAPLVATPSPAPLPVPATATATHDPTATAPAQPRGVIVTDRTAAAAEGPAPEPAPEPPVAEPDPAEPPRAPLSNDEAPPHDITITPTPPVEEQPAGMPEPTRDAPTG